MKILVVTKNWLGDILFELPAIEVLKAHYPEAEIVCLTPPRGREILESHPAISRVIAFDERKEHRSLFARLKLLRVLRRESWDQAYLFHRSRTRAFFTFLAGAKERIGYGKGRRIFLTRAVPEPQHPMHQMDYFLRLLKEVGLTPPQNPHTRLYLSAETLQRGESLLTRHELIREGVLAPFAAFHLGANWEPKRWPPEHFAALADLIHEKWNLPIVVTGSACDRKLLDRMISSIQKARVISLIGETSLKELASVFSKSLFVVSGDSGPLHVAASAGANVVGLFGPTDPKLTGPRGAGDSIILTHLPAGLRAPWFGPLPEEGWLSHILPQDVIQAIEEKKWVLPLLGDKAQEAQRPIGGGRRQLGKIVSHSLPPVKNILLITLSNIGDVILTTPVITALTAQFSGAKLTVVCGPRARGILEGSRFIDRVVIYDKNASFSEQWRFLQELRRKDYDFAIDLRHTAIPYLVSAKRRSPLLRFRAKRAMRERHLEILARMKILTAPLAFDFFHPEDEASLNQKLMARGLAQRGWILVAAQAASELKTWRLEGFEEVIERLLQDYAQPILLVGDARERPQVQPLTEIDPQRIHNVAGQTTLRELAALVSRSSLLLTNDSAVMHLGFELDRPVVAVFGPTHHEKYGRRGPNFRMVREPVFCSPCERSTCRFERQSCFEDLSAEKVYDACKELLEYCHSEAEGRRISVRDPSPAWRQAQDDDKVSS